MPISFDIELHEITDLTWPMWEACSVTCPAMIGADCPRKEGDSCPGWSAKFTNAASEVVHQWTLDSGQSEECGDAGESDAWFALFRNPDEGTFDGPMGAGVILCVTSRGFVQATRFATKEELDKDWNTLLDETHYCPHGNPACFHEVLCTACEES